MCFPLRLFRSLPIARGMITLSCVIRLTAGGWGHQPDFTEETEDLAHGWSNRFGRKRSGVVGAGVEIIGMVVSWQ